MLYLSAFTVKDALKILYFMLLIHCSSQNKWYKTFSVLGIIFEFLKVEPVQKYNTMAVIKICIFVCCTCICTVHHMKHPYLRLCIMRKNMYFCLCIICTLL